MLTILALYHIVALRRPCMLCLQLTVFIQMRPLQPLRLIGVTPVDLGIINQFYSRLLESEYFLVLNPISLLHLIPSRLVLSCPASPNPAKSIRMEKAIRN